MALFGYIAGLKLAGQLGVPSASDLGDSFGQAMLSALLEPGDGERPGMGVLAGPAAGQEERAHSSPVRDLGDDSTSGPVADVVRRIFSGGSALKVRAASSEEFPPLTGYLPRRTSSTA
jgi:hypothetical protein